MRVSVVGVGYVGLVTAAGLAELGHDVVCVDVDEARIATISAGRTPIHEPGLQELLERTVGIRLRTTTDVGEAVAGSDLTLVAVGTPERNGEQDLDALRAAVASIGSALARKQSYHVVVVKSTVLPGTTGGVVRQLLEERSGRRVGPALGLGASPEFLTEGRAVADFLAPDRIVLGGVDERTHSALEELHEAFPAHIPRLRTNLETAEMIKYASNALLASAISFANEIGNVCARLDGVDVVDVQRGVHLSRYLTSYGDGEIPVLAPIASYLEAGCGFGGSCLPKDTRALVALGERVGAPMPVLRAVLETNERQPDEIVRLLEARLERLDSSRIAVLGLAFKPDTDDVRETPTAPIVERLAGRGADLTIHDPVVRVLPERLARLPRVALTDDLEAALADADAVVLVTSWRDYEELPTVLARRNPPPLVVDGRRMLSAQAVARYSGIGA